MKPPAIQTENLTCKFDNLVAVNQLTLHVPHGIIFGFLGQNGAGKTTTIRMLLGLLEPSAGQAQVLGFNIATEGQAVRERTGALLEHNGLYERMTAVENLEYYGRIYCLPAADRKRRIQELLSHLSLWERRNDLVSTWSKGMRQKLAVARAMLHHPALVILDEPTSGLDPLAAIELREDLLSLRDKEGTTIFLNTHNLPEAEKLCDLVGIIHKGNLLTIAAPRELMIQNAGVDIEICGDNFKQALVDRLHQHPDVQNIEMSQDKLHIRLTESQAANEIIALVAQSGVNIRAIERGKTNLEDIFVNMIRGQNE
jgi:ABC-2 type transport system ATP-binding protein